MNEDISNKDKLRTSVWQGSVTTFDKLVENGELIKGMIYFVGDSASGGLPTSSAGGIYVATSERKAVPFGSSSEHSVKEYRTASSFPTTGIEGRLYIASDTGMIYRWNGSAYVVIGGYTDGYGIDITSAGEIKTEPISDAEIDAMSAGERNGHLLDNLGLVRLWNRIVAFFVQKEEGKGLSSNDYTDAEKTKLAGIEHGAEVNVQSDWNESDSTKDDYIKNKPTLRQPATDGTAGQYLKSNGSNNAPSWETMDSAPTASSTKAVTSGGVKTALDAKQNTISITTNTSTPADNDTVIMQASGTTNTTTFLRRTMSKIWDYIKSKADSVYWNATKVEINIPSSINRKKKILSTHTNDTFYALNERYPVTWKTYTTETDELYEDNASRIPNLFNGYLENVYGHPLTGEYDIVEMDFTGASGGYFPPSYTSSSGAEAYLTLHFRGSFPEQTPKVEYCVPNSSTWVEVSGESINDNTYKIFAYKINARLANLRITVIGKTGGESNPSYKGASIANIFFMSGRGRGVEQYDIVTKYKFKQDLYGEVEAPKFIKRGGTNKQALLANGTTAALPLTMENGGTQATDWKGAEYNVNQRLRATEISASINDNTLIPFLRDSDRDVTNGIFAGYRKALALWDYIKGKADNVYTQKGDAYTVNMSSDSNHQGTNEYRVLATLATADCCVLNITKTIYGYPSQNTVWFANQNAMSLISLSDFGFVAIGGRAGQSADLCVPVLPTGHPSVEYKIQIVRSTDSESVTFPASATYKTQNRPMKANVVMRDEISTDAVTFNITSGIGSVSLEDSNDFIGNVTDSSTSAGITVTNYEQGQCYRFTFTEELEGVTLYSSNSVALCTVNETIQKGDVLTFTSVSNTAGGWMYSKTGASIKSSDGSVGIEWEDGVADLKVEKVPFNNLVNNAMFEEGDSPKPLAIGEDAEAEIYTDNSSYPRAFSVFSNPVAFQVDGADAVYYYNVTSGTTYTIKANNTTTTFTADGTGRIFIIDYKGPVTPYIDKKWKINENEYQIVQVQRLGSSGSSAYMYIARTDTTSVSTIVQTTKLIGYAYSNVELIRLAVGNDAKAFGNYGAMAVGPSAKAYGQSSIAVGYGAESGGTSSSAVGYGAKANYYETCAFGNAANATDSSAIAVGTSAKARASDAGAIGNRSTADGERSLAVGNGSKALGSYSTAVGERAAATESNATAIGEYTKASASGATTLGALAEATANYAMALGYYASVKGLYSVAIGYQSKAYSERSVAIGNYSATALENAIAVGDKAYAGYDSNDSDYPKYQVKRFTAIDFTENGVTKKVRWVGSNDEVTIVLNGNTVTLSAPNNNSKFFIIVNDSLGVRIGKPITSYAKINGVETYCNIGGYNVTPVAVNGNSYYALWMYSTQSYFQNTIDSFSFLAYYKATYSQGYMFAFGYNAVATNTHAIAFGNETRAIRDRQIVIGSGNLPDENALFIIGGGSSAANARKNILIIDSNEVMHVRGIVNEVRTIDTGGTSAIVTQIKQGVLKVTGGGSLELSTTGAVEGLSVKIYASGASVLITNSNINYAVQSGCFHEFIFLDGDWHAQM